MEFESEHAAKLFFAKMLYERPKDALQIAKNVLGDYASQNPLEVIRISEEWPVDAVVLEELDKLSRTLKDKEVIANEIYKAATLPFIPPEEYSKRMRLYCEVRGFIGRAEDITKKNGNGKLDELIEALAD